MLNLPEQISIFDKGRIEYLYDAAGIKLRQKVFPTNASLEETNYVGNFIYEGESTPSVPSMMVELWFKSVTWTSVVKTVVICFRMLWRMVIMQQTHPQPFPNALGKGV